MRKNYLFEFEVQNAILNTIPIGNTTFIFSAETSHQYQIS